MLYSVEELTGEPSSKDLKNIQDLSGLLVGSQVPEDVLYRNVNELVSSQSQLFFVARGVADIIGMTILTKKVLPHQRTAYWDSLIVHPEHRERGVARMLASRVMEYADEHGLIIQGATSPKRREAWNLYQQLGFNQWDSRFIVRLPKSAK